LTERPGEARPSPDEHRDRASAVLVRPPWAHRLRILPSALLILVASQQLLLAHTSGLSAWSGGGFGMFSSTDAGGRRHLHAFVLRPGLRREVRPPPSLAEQVRRSLTLPSDANLRALAAEIADVPTPDYGPPTAVEIQVWHTRFDPEALTPRGRILRAIEVPLDSG
jgi:hypothetical protein